MENNNNKNKIFHVLSEDLNSAIQDNKDGLIKRIIEEEGKKEEEKRINFIYTKKNRMYLFLTFFIILFSFLILFFIFFAGENKLSFFRKRTDLMIFHENTKYLDITNKKREDLQKEVVKSVISSNQKVGAIEVIYFLENKKQVGLNRFLELIESDFSIKENNLFQDNFLIGSLKYDVNLSKEEEKDKPKEKEKLVEFSKDKLNNFIILSTMDFFNETSYEFIDEIQKQKAKSLIGYFLDTISFENYIIKIIGIYPKEKFVEEDISAEKRKNIGLEIFSEVVREKFTEEEISKIKVESLVKSISLNEIYSEYEISLMSEEEKNLKINLNSGIQFLFEKEIHEEIKEEKINEEDLIEWDKEIAKENDLFILLKRNNVGDILKGMYEWENKIFSDFYGFFGIKTSLDKSYLLVKNFEDGIVQNKNARILYDENREIVLMYVFIDENFVIITKKPETVKEILLRINSSKIKK